VRALEIGDVEEDCWSRCNRARPVGQVRGGGKGEQVEFFFDVAEEEVEQH